MKHLRKLHRASVFWPLLILSFTIIFLWRHALAQSPRSGQTATSHQLIPFQGRLTNQAGVPYENGQFTVTFNLYSLAVGGPTVWTERHEKVSVINGMINVFLGSINSIDSVDFATTKYLGITIDADGNPATADPEMVPRTMIVPSFASKQAERARTMDVLDANGLPVANQSYGWSAVFSDGSPISGTIAGSKITAATVSTTQIQDGAITANKVADRQITSSKLAVSEVLTPGSIIMHHTYNGSSPVPRGWLTCDGAQITQARYESEHGPGSFIGDGVSTSPLLNKYLPDFERKYAVGSAATSAAGNDPIPVVGNIGNKINLSHTHSIPAHQHQWIAQNDRGYAMKSWNASGNLVTLNNAQPNTGTRIQLNSAGSGIGAVAGVDVDYYTSKDGDAKTGDSSNVTASIQPESIQVKYIMRVK